MVHVKHEQRSLKELRKMPLPANDLELKACTLWYFGVPLSLKKFTFSGPMANYEAGGSYEVRQDFDSYNKLRHRTRIGYSRDRYDYSHDFWNRVFGELGCGGTARASYGQFKIKSYRKPKAYRQEKRLSKWIRSRRPEQLCKLRKPFERLVLKLYGEEGISWILDSRS